MGSLCKILPFSFSGPRLAISHGITSLGQRGLDRSRGLLKLKKILHCTRFSTLLSILCRAQCCWTFGARQFFLHAKNQKQIKNWVNQKKCRKCCMEIIKKIWLIFVQSHPKNLENYGCVEMERKKNSVSLKNFLFICSTFFHIPKFGLKKSELK